MPVRLHPRPGIRGLMARIRTIKPDAWHDEDLIAVSRDARLLFAVLITMADDDGRFRPGVGIIFGHGYPEDEDALALIPGWLAELTGAGLVHIYEVDGARFACLPGWSKHQRISKPTPSRLPAPPAASQGNPGDPRETRSGSGSGRGKGEEGSAEGTPLAAPATPDETPDFTDWPEGLNHRLRMDGERIAAVLNRVADAKRTNRPTRAALGRILAEFPDHDHLGIVGEFEMYWVHGAGSRTRRRDIARTYRYRCSQLTARPAAVEQSTQAHDPDRAARFEARRQARQAALAAAPDPPPAA